MDIFAIGQASKWIERRAKIENYTEKEDSPFYFPFVEYQVQIEQDRISSYCHTLEFINDASRIEDAALISFELSPENEKIIFHHLNILRNEKTIDVLFEDNIGVIQRETGLESHITDEKLTVNLSIDDLREGDGIDYAYTVIESANQHPLRGKVFDSMYRLNWGCPVESQRVRCINHSDKGLTVSFSETGQKYQESTIEHVSPGDVFDKTYHDLMSSNVDKSAPNWIWEDNIQITTTQTWQSVSADLYQYYADTDIGELTTELKEIELLELSGDVTKDIIHVVRFVQDNIRYKGEHKGIYTHTPKDPNITLKKRFGDCKDKSNLLVHLLKKLGVESRLLLVNSSYGRYLHKRSPSPYRFNHMIVEVLYDDQSYVFDPTIQKQRGDINHLTELFYGWSLPVIESGSDLQEIPLNLNKKVFNLHHKFDFRAASKEQNIDGVLEIKRQFFYHRANNFRYFFSSKSHALIEKEFLDYVKSDTELDLTVSEGIHITKDDEDNNVFETLEKYHIQNVAETHKEAKVELLTKFYQEFPDTATGNYPIMIELDGSLEHLIEVQYDEAYDYDNSEKSVKNKYFDYYDVFTRSKTELTFKSTIQIESDIVAQEDIQYYLQDVKDMKSRCNSLFPWQSSPKKEDSKEGSPWWWFLIAIVFIAAAVLDKFT